MKIPTKLKAPSVLAAVLLLLSCALGVYSAGQSEAASARRIALAAAEVLGALDDEQRAKAFQDFAHGERKQWNYLPSVYPGVPLGELSVAQKRAVHRLLNAALSESGYHKTTTIMRLEQTLREAALAAGRDGEAEWRDASRYSLAFFGEPSDEEPWGFRLQGHHLSWNFSSVDQRISALPTFLGSNPAELRDGPLAGLRALPREEDLARELLASFDERQLGVAVVGEEAPQEVFWRPGREREVLGEPIGLAYGDLAAAQRETLWSLIETYANNLDEQLAARHLAKIERAGRETIRFAWMGSRERGEGHYYRIHGPTFVIEYDNTQNGANHVHSVWHDLTDDFGADLLRQHYDEKHR